MRPPVEAVIARTQDFIKIPSLSRTPEEQRLQRTIADTFIEAGIRPVITSSFVYAKLTGANTNKLFVIMSHPDVVPADDADKWQHPPFAGTIENDMLHGRGASDMKAGLAAGMEVLLRTKKSSTPPPCDIMFISTVEEETTGKGAKAVMPVLRNEVDRHEEVGIVYTEPSGMTHVFYGHKGNIPATATAQGKTFHTALINNTPKDSYASGKILKFGNRVLEQNERWQKEFADDIDTPTVAVPDLIGNNGSVFNQAAGEVGLKIDIRTIPNNHSSAQSVIDEIARDCGVTVKYEIPTEPVVGERYSPLTHILQDISPHIKIGLFPASADMSHVVKGLKPQQLPKTHHAILGPGYIDLAHQRDEHVPIDHILRITELYLEACKRFATY